MKSRNWYLNHFLVLLGDENENSRCDIDGITFLNPYSIILKHFGDLFITLYANTDLVSTYGPIGPKYPSLGQKWSFFSQNESKIDIISDKTAYLRLKTCLNIFLISNMQFYRKLCQFLTHFG